MNYSLITVCVLAICVAIHGSIIGTMQKIAVKGHLRCESEPQKAINVRVKLVDKDPGPDDLLQEGKTNGNGKFHLHGQTRELTSIDPRLHIYHDCNDGLKPCHRHWKLRVPDKYIDGEVYDFGTLNLETILPDEGRKCFT